MPRIGCIACLLAIGLAGCGSSSHNPPAGSAIRTLKREARPIGRGIRFHEPVSGAMAGHCRPSMGRRIAVHVELFAANRVVLIPAGIGVRGPTRHVDGRITHARCYGNLVTLDPTGVVHVRAGSRLTLGDLFSAWGEPLSPRRLAAFSASPGRSVRSYIGGRRRSGPPQNVPLARHAEIVLEVGPYVPPHRSFSFPDGA
jgi:hypothetical protein